MEKALRSFPRKRKGKTAFERFVYKIRIFSYGSVLLKCSVVYMYEDRDCYQVLLPALYSYQIGLKKEQICKKKELLFTFTVKKHFFKFKSKAFPPIC